MVVGLDDYSRFKDTPPTTFRGHPTFGYWVLPSVLENLRDDQIITYVVDITTVGKPHMISYELYNTTLLDWMLIAFNKQLGVFGWPKVGTVIKAPTITVLASTIW